MLIKKLDDHSAELAALERLSQAGDCQRPRKAQAPGSMRKNRFGRKPRNRAMQGKGVRGNY
jgi:hypothetical protein